MPSYYGACFWKPDRRRFICFIRKSPGSPCRLRHDLPYIGDSMYQTTRGLVLRETEYKDYDKLLTVLTEDSGLMTVRAWGVKRKSSPLKSACQLLTFSEFTIQEKQGFCGVREASPVEMFSALRGDIELLSLASYFAQATEVLAQEDMPNPELLSLVLNCLYGLSKMNEPEDKIKSVFELRSACLAGYTPDLSACRYCGCDQPDRFNIAEGMLECVSCGAHGDGLRMPITAGILDAMRYICVCDSKRIFAFQTQAQTYQDLSHITESYLLTQLERGFSALDFYKSLSVLPSS